MSKHTSRTPKRKKKTVAQIKAKRKSVEKFYLQLRNAKKTPFDVKNSEEKMQNFTWEELAEYHATAEEMFVIAAPVVMAIRNTAIIEQIKKAGNLDRFTTLATQLDGQLKNYRVALDNIAESYKGRVVTDENLLEEVGKAVGISEEYRQWLDSFRSVIIEGLNPDLSEIITNAQVAATIGANNE